MSGGCCAWGVLVKSSMRKWKSDRGRSLGNILGEDISNLLLLEKVN